MVVVPLIAKDKTPFIALSKISKLLFVVVPQAPACSPAPIFSMPLFAVYVLALFTSYTSVHVSDPDGVIVV